MRKKVFGHGINDVDSVCDGNGNKEQAYKAWTTMLSRCYSPSHLKRSPWYVGTVVCDEWLRYSVFRKWWVENQVDGWDLDKDLIGGGKKIYSADTCIFVPRWINTFIRAKPAGKSLPIGCSFHKASGKYRADICIGGKVFAIGLFDSAEDANAAWAIEKLIYANQRREEMDAIDKMIFQSIVSKVNSWIVQK